MNGTSIHNEDDDDDTSAIQQYYAMEEWCRQEIAAGSDFLFDTTTFASTLKHASHQLRVPYHSLHSFFRSLYTQHLKAQSYAIRSRFATHHLPRYTQHGNSIRQMAVAEQRTEIANQHRPTLAGQGLKRWLNGLGLISGQWLH